MIIFVSIILAFLLLAALHASETKLWYNHSPKDWMTETLPIGNGRLSPPA